MSFPARAYRILAEGFTFYRLATLANNAFLFPRLRPQPLPPGTLVSLLVPARDEADNLRRFLPGLLAQTVAGQVELLVLDDHSSDGTASIARQLGARVLSGQPLPPGWAGKPWACQQLAQAARGDVLVFTDADVAWHLGALGALLAQMQATGADLLSVWPQQTNRSFGERLLTPLAEVPLLTLFPLPFLLLPHPAASAANGQVMAFQREFYWHMGGHATVRGEVLEDMRLARRVREAGGRLRLALGADCITVRMYRSYPESVRGFGKNLLAFHGGKRWALVLGWLLSASLYALPWLVRRPEWKFLRLFSVTERLLVNLIAGRRRPADLAEGLLGPLMPLLTLPVYGRAAARRVKWKGREYRQ